MAYGMLVSIPKENYLKPAFNGESVDIFNKEYGPAFHSLEDLNTEIQKGEFKFNPMRVFYEDVKNDYDSFETFLDFNFHLYQNPLENVQFKHIEKMLMWNFDVFRFIPQKKAFRIETVPSNKTEGTIDDTEFLNPIN